MIGGAFLLPRSTETVNSDGVKFVEKVSRGESGKMLRRTLYRNGEFFFSEAFAENGRTVDRGGVKRVIDWAGGFTEMKILREGVVVATYRIGKNGRVLGSD